MKVSGDRKRELSCSIGISMFPADGSDFTTLYQRADYALYQGKEGREEPICLL